MQAPNESAPTGPGEVTVLLRQASAGDREAFSRLVTLVYRELGNLARLRLGRERTGHTLGTTALVHEAYLRLADQSRIEWQNREQFFAIASEAMRRILVDHARGRLREKRGGRHEHLPLNEAEDIPELSLLIGNTDADQLVALDEALHRLAAFNPQGARIVQYRFFAGLQNDEIARLLDISERSVRRSWTAARAWLKREVGSQWQGAGPNDTD
ncbi:MAG: ECF-type sigma factor [Gemmatimonadota bacterium]